MRWPKPTLSPRRPPPPLAHFCRQGEGADLQAVEERGNVRRLARVPPLRLGFPFPARQKPAQPQLTLSFPLRTTEALAAKYKVRQQRIMAIVALKQLEHMAREKARTTLQSPRFSLTSPIHAVLPLNAPLPPLAARPLEQGQPLNEQYEAEMEKETGVVSEGSGEVYQSNVRHGNCFTHPPPSASPV